MGVPGYAPILPPAAQPGLTLFHSLSKIGASNGYYGNRGLGGAGRA